MMQPIISHPSPNFDERAQPISVLMMHYTGMQSGAEALARLCDAESKVSAHYLIEEDGRIFQMVEESKRAWHAGAGSWQGRGDLNGASIGIEIVNKGHEWGYEPFVEAQMDSIMALSQQILSRHAIEPRNVIGHSDIAPTRKQDPGELFDWPRLAGQGIGLYPAVSHQLSAVSSDKLAQYGYDLSDETAAIVAFQRHFRPSRLDGVWDDECGQRLASLLQQL